MSSQPKKRKLWSTVDMEAAMSAVTNEKMPCATAAKKFGVPRKSHENRVKGRVKHGVNPGPATTLTSEEEKALTEYIKYASQRGFSMTKKICKAYAWAVAKKSGRRITFKQTGPSDKWWRGFRKRCSGLALRKCDTLDRGRARMANQTVMDGYFKLLRETLEKLGIKDCPDRLYNCDESGISLDPKKEKVIVPVGTKHVYSQQAGTRDHITVHCCVNAAGEYLPPMIIYEKSYPSGAYTRSGPENALYSKSPNGYMDTELYFLWFTRIFLKYATKERPILLIQDGHGSHISPELIDKARQNNVEIMCLPPHTTHVLQPLDKVMFGPLKKAWSSAITTLGYANKSFILNKNDFARVFRTPYEKTFTPTVIQTSFKKTGICPFDPDAIDKSQLYPTAAHDKAPDAPSTPCTSSDSNTESSSASSRTSSNSSTPVSSQTSPCPTCGSSGTNPKDNPLVSAGLIPEHLHDILAITNYVSTTKKRPRVVTKARVITNEEYLEEIRKKEKEKEEEEAKKAQKEKEREIKKKEAEKKKEEMQRKREERQKKAEERKKSMEEKKGSGRQKKQATKKGGECSTPSRVRESVRKSKRKLEDDFVTLGDSDSQDSDEDSSNIEDTDEEAREEREVESEEEDDEACFKCGSHEPPSDCEDDVSWFQCDNENCERWYHSFCLQKKEKPHRGYQWSCPICVANSSE